MFASCEYRALPDRGLCVRLIICPEESYRVWWSVGLSVFDEPHTGGLGLLGL